MLHDKMETHLSHQYFLFPQKSGGRIHFLLFAFYNNNGDIQMSLNQHLEM